MGENQNLMVSQLSLPHGTITGNLQKKGFKNHTIAGNLAIQGQVPACKCSFVKETTSLW